MDPLYAELLAEHWLQITFMHLVTCFFAGMVGYWLSSWLHDLADWLCRRFLEKAIALPPRSASPPDNLRPVSLAHLTAEDWAAVEDSIRDSVRRYHT